MQDSFQSFPKPKKRKLNILPENPQQDDKAKAVSSGRFPSWLHRPLSVGSGVKNTEEILQENRLPTVCEEAKCPNLNECWAKKTATFLAMGKDCTRSCGFCDVDFAKTPKPLEEDEPIRIANSVKSLGLEHVVITMVARDDLPDGGAAHLAKIIQEIRKLPKKVTIELLTSDFQGSFSSLETVLDQKPEIFNHNIETVEALTPKVRHKAEYRRTLSLLAHAKEYAPNVWIKSGLMLGLGESKEEIHQTLQDLQSAGCQIVTMGQYLQPNRRKLRVQSFVAPETFSEYARFGRSIGLAYVHAGPFVRSSYNAADLFKKLKGKKL